MELAFNEELILEEETNIELFASLCKFRDKMDAHIIKFPNYNYSIILLGGKKGAYQASVIIERYDNNKTEISQGDSNSYGVL